MTDAASDPARINNTVKVVTALSVLVLAIFSIVWLLLHGQSNNSLHVSALSWSYTMIAGILVAFGFGAISDMVATIITRKA